MDTASGKAGTARKEFSRMLEDCKAHKMLAGSYKKEYLIANS